MEASESEKVIQRLNQELQEANEQANSGKHKCVELQGKEGTLYLFIVCRSYTYKTAPRSTLNFVSLHVFIYVKCMIIQ